MKPEVQLQQPELWPITVDWELRFSRPQAQKAFAYWQSLLAGRQMPARRELTPRAMKAFITYVNLVDVLSLGNDKWDYVISLQSADAHGCLATSRDADWWRFFHLPSSGDGEAVSTCRAQAGRR